MRKLALLALGAIAWAGDPAADDTRGAPFRWRPTIGPDGSVYFLDWHNALIGHMQHHLRDPSRDHSHGRIYRISAKGRARSGSAAR